MKKTVSFLLCVLLIFSLAACGKDSTPKAEETTVTSENVTYTRPEKEPVAQGQLIGDVVWELFDDGSLFVDGNGKMPDWAKIKDLAWRDKIQDIKSVYIGKGITKIGNYAFAYCKNLSSVYVSETVTHIGDSAFIRCENLKTVRLPGSVTEIGEFAFAHCLSLESVNIPESVTKLGDTAFGGCTKIKEIKLHGNVSYVGAYCFAGWTEEQVISVANDESYISENWSEDWNINCSASQRINHE